MDSVKWEGTSPSFKDAFTNLQEIDKAIQKISEKLKDPGLDEYSRGETKKLIAELIKEAGEITRKYEKKASTINFLSKAIFSVEEKTSELQTGLQRILLRSPQDLVLPEDLETKRAQAKETISKAQEYGYEGKDFSQANLYLTQLFKEMERQHKHHWINKKVCVYDEKTKKFDPEATLIKCIADWEAGGKKKNPKVLDNCASAPLLKVFLDKGCDPNGITENGRTLLQEASMFGHTEIVRLLLTREANPNKIGTDRSPPLHKAVWSMNSIDPDLKIVKLLLKAGANPEAENEHGSSSLSLAETRQLGAVVYLLKQKIEQQKQEDRGRLQ